MCGERRARSPDCGLIRTFVEAETPRVACREHGVTVAAVPWARHRAGHTYSFDQTVAWLATHTSKAATCELMRTAWRTVGAIVERVWADTAPARDPLAGLRRIGIDEISYKKGHKYLTVVVDHDSGRLVWAAPGRDTATLSEFFDLLGPERCAKITHVTSDAAGWIASVVTRYCPAAIRCADPFHVVAWATEALDAVRRAAWNRARAGRERLPRRRLETAPTPEGRAGSDGQTQPVGAAEEPGHAQCAATGESAVDRIARSGATPGIPAQGGPAVDPAAPGHRSRHRTRPVDRLGETVPDPGVRRVAEKHPRPQTRDPRRHRTRALVRPDRIGQPKIRLITRRGFGFHTPEAVIALAMLSLGGARPQLPGRTQPRMSQ